MPTSPAENVCNFGLLVKSWASGLDYLSQAAGPPPAPSPSGSPTDPIPNGARWALPAMADVGVPLAAGGGAAAIKATAMSWQDFELILGHASNVMPMGAITNPTNATKVVVVQGDEQTMLLRLPPRARMVEAEKKLLAGDTNYGIPSFYDDLYKGPNGAAATRTLPTATDDSGKQAILKLHACRIGDYTMSSCN